MFGFINRLMNNDEHVSNADGASYNSVGQGSNFGQARNECNKGKRLTSSISSSKFPNQQPLSPRHGLSNVFGKAQRASNLFNSSGFDSRFQGSKFIGPSSSSDMSRGPMDPTSVPEVDLSGLTEEEKLKIQSVMLRAQEIERNDAIDQMSTNPESVTK